MLSKYKKLIFFLFLLIIIYTIDLSRISLNKKPIFVVKTATVKDGGTSIYYGLGYKVIGWSSLSTKEINGKEYSGVLKGYEVSFIPFFQDINDGPRKELEFLISKGD